MDLHEKEKMYQRLIIFTLLIGMVIYYFEKIIGFLAWIGGNVFAIFIWCRACLCV